MYILHIETSTQNCSVALSQGDVLAGYLESNEGMNHTATLTPMIQRLLASASIKPGDLGAISVSSGPGSYTGLRVGSSTAKAMAYSLKIPLISIPTLSSLALAGFNKYPKATYALPMMDARRNEVYISLFDRNMKVLFPTSSLILEKGALNFIPELNHTDKENKSQGISSKSFSGIICCGDGCFKLNPLGLSTPDMIIDDSILPSARYLVNPAFSLLTNKEYSDPMHFVPFYLKPPNITKQRKGL